MARPGPNHGAPAGARLPHLDRSDLADATSRPRPFIGRDRELSELRAGLAAAAAGTGTFYLIAGEPGIGKTRLINELASGAAAKGAKVLRGFGVEDSGAPPYWPWIQVLRGCAAGSPPRIARASRSLLSTLAPEEEPRAMPARSRPMARDGEALRFRLFESFVALFRSLSVAAPCVVILDDLQWADESSLLLLQFFARGLAGMRTRVLLVAAYRDVEARLSPEANRHIATLACEARTLYLHGLTKSEVALLLEGTCGRALPDPLASAVHRGTGGNPLFVDEVLRTLVVEGRLEQPLSPGGLPLPERVRALIHRRMRSVSPRCRRVLAVAATLARDCDLGVLEVACGEIDDQPLDVVGEAQDAGILLVSAGRVSFTHDLFREVLYDDLGEGERSARHAEVGRALEGLHAKARDVELHLPELAHHFFRAGSAHAEKAVEYSTRAAARATRGYAFAEAVVHYRRAVDRLASGGSRDITRRCRLLLALGDALWSTGEFAAAKQTYSDAADLADGAGLAEELARAALGFGGPYVGFGAGDVDHRLIALLEKSLVACGDPETALRVSLLARLAAALTYAAPIHRDRSTTLARQAVESARRLGDAATLHFALTCLVFSTWSPDNLEERLAIGREITRSSAHGEAADAATFHGLLTSVSHVENGDLASAERETSAYGRRTGITGQRISSWFLGVHRAARALLEGRFSEVEGLALEALRLGQQAQNPGAAQLFGVQLLALRREQGRLVEIAEGVERLVEEHPAVPAWRAARAMVHAAIGCEDDARRDIDALGASDFADVPRDMFWLSGMWLLTETVDRLGSARHAETLYALLRPYGRRFVHVGAAFCAGSVQRSLGLLATAAARYDDAIRHFEGALTENTRVGATPWVAHTLHDHARVLLLRNDSSDRARASELLRRAEASARALEMEELSARIEILLAGVAGAPSLLAGEAVFRREGEYWTVAYDGRSASVRDGRGLRLIALLLASPGRDISTRELAAWPAPPETAALSTAAVEAAGLRVVDRDQESFELDAQARSEYRAHLGHLRAEAEEAERANDRERAERAREEIALVTEQLVAAARTGKRGRTAESERARLSVSKAIRYAIDKVERVHPPLARLLADGVKTGRSCRYEPDPSRPVRWLL